MILYNQYIQSHSSQIPAVKIRRATANKISRPYIEHSHSDFEIALFVRGKGRYIVGKSDDRREYQFNAGDIFVFSSNELHYITEITEEHCEYISIHFDPKYLWESSTSGISEENSNFCFFHSPTFENRLPRHNINTERIKSLILESEKEITGKKTEYKMMIKTYINEMVIICIRSLGYVSADSTGYAPSHTKAIKNAISYIDANLNKPLSLEAISTIAKMSPNYFCTVFKKTNNITVFDYIISKRCDLAAQLLLANPDLNVIEIAERCGFNNSANFNKSFKKRVGITPSEYRRNNEIF